MSGKNTGSFTRAYAMGHFYAKAKSSKPGRADANSVSVTKRFFFKLPIRNVKIAKKSPAFLKNYSKLPEFWAKIITQNQLFYVLLFFINNFFRVHKNFLFFEKSRELNFFSEYWQSSPNCKCEIQNLIILLARV